MENFVFVNNLGKDINGKTYQYKNLKFDLKLFYKSYFRMERAWWKIKRLFIFTGSILDQFMYMQMEVIKFAESPFTVYMRA